MRYYRVADRAGTRLVAATDGDAYDLTAARPRLDRFVELARAADLADETVDDVAAGLLDAAAPVDRDALRGAAASGSGSGDGSGGDGERGADGVRDLALPVVPGEVWAAGVTYAISERAREAESGMPDIYLDVYDAERPELFLKATASRTVASGDAVGVRADSDWNVPEPELGVVLHEGRVVGYTVGNDVSSRAIEGANPLYLPQAKVYDRSCAVGPCVASPETVGDPHDLAVSMTIDRDGETLYDESTSTAEMVRSCEELVDYLARHNALPETTVLLTGTTLVPEEFTLRPGDRVEITVENVGTLVNGTVEV
jgi:2-dehydro-3-deoxy-D-arabinonate dehydratase